MNSEPFTIERLGEKGRGLVATRDLDITDCILEEPAPLAILDNKNLETTCSNCFATKGRPLSYQLTPRASSVSAPDKKFLRCGGCGVVKYCDKVCQKRSWSLHHKQECGIFAKLRPKILPTIVRAAIRVLLQEGVFYFSTFLGLERHESALKTAGGSRWADILLMAKAAKEYSNTKHDEDWAVSIVCRILINSITLMSVTNDPMGLALGFLTARINHSCDYNAVVRFSHQGTITVVPLRKIRKDQEITIAYIDCTMPYPRRQSELSERYFFRCECNTCGRGMGGWLDKLSDNQTMSITLAGIEDKAAKLLELARKDTGSSAPILKLRYGLHLLHTTGVWPLSRYPYPAIRNDLILAYLKDRQYHLAFVQALIRYRRVDPVLMPDACHPVRMVNAWVVIELMDHINSGEDCAIQQGDIYDSQLKLRLLKLDLMQKMDTELQKTNPRGAFYRLLSNKCRRFRHFRSMEDVDEDAVKAEWVKIDKLVEERIAEEEVWGKN